MIDKLEEPSKRREVYIEKMRFSVIIGHICLLALGVNILKITRIDPFISFLKKTQLREHVFIGFLVVALVFSSNYALANNFASLGVINPGLQIWSRENKKLVSPEASRGVQDTIDKAIQMPAEASYTVGDGAFFGASIPPQLVPRPEYTVERTVKIPITAYSSTPDQTDSTPFITASGTYVQDGIVAANFLPIGTKIKIPELYGEKIFVVEDRMNSRYWYNMDIWMPTRSEAQKFGLKIAYVDIVEEI